MIRGMTATLAQIRLCPDLEVDSQFLCNRFVLGYGRFKYTTGPTEFLSLQTGPILSQNEVRCSGESVNACQNL